MAKHEDQYITQISTSITVKGDIIGESDVRIAGSIIGTVSITGDLIVEKTGVVEGEVKVNNATIAGTIKGNIECIEKLTLESTSKFTGNIKTKQLIIENGAFFQGGCVMPSNESAL
ncbi:MAG: polymer-forming cytoskeletal protein [Crenarchaeota archaeon]|jgi:cytoskeletal protein CcmA (bactofilin family)|nr:polymer-forming cytoskeletal protein [Thermoproteota archaeon]